MANSEPGPPTVALAPPVSGQSTVGPGGFNESATVIACLGAPGPVVVQVSGNVSPVQLTLSVPSGQLNGQIPAGGGSITSDPVDSGCHNLTMTSGDYGCYFGPPCQSPPHFRFNYVVNW